MREKSKDSDSKRLEHSVRGGAEDSKRAEDSVREELEDSERAEDSVREINHPEVNMSAHYLAARVKS